MAQRPFKKSVRAVLYHEDNLVLVKQKDGRWGLPGGEIDYAENDLTALMRELGEELGFLSRHLFVENVDPVRYTLKKDNRNYDLLHVTIFLVRVMDLGAMKVNKQELRGVKLGSLADIEYEDSLDAAKKLWVERQQLEAA